MPSWSRPDWLLRTPTPQIATPLSQQAQRATNTPLPQRMRQGRDGERSPESVRQCSASAAGFAAGFAAPSAAGFAAFSAAGFAAWGFLSFLVL